MGNLTTLISTRIQGRSSPQVDISTSGRVVSSLKLGLADGCAACRESTRLITAFRSNRSTVAKALRVLLGAVALFAVSGADAGRMYSRRSHAAPYPFLFGNDFDTHQQSRLSSDGNLCGSLYVRYTGVVTTNGDKVAGHVNCNAVPDDCVVG